MPAVKLQLTPKANELHWNRRAPRYFEKKKDRETHLQAADAETIQAKAALELAERARQTLNTRLADNQALPATLCCNVTVFRLLAIIRPFDERAGDLRRDREQKETYLRNVED